mgnify:FL=1
MPMGMCYKRTIFYGGTLMRLPKRLHFFKAMIVLALVSIACGNFTTAPTSGPE